MIRPRYLVRHAHEAAGRETHRRKDDKRKTLAMLGAVMAALQLRSVSGYWQNHGARHAELDFDDFFANFS
jgi:hypothetical protein